MKNSLLPRLCLFLLLFHALPSCSKSSHANAWTSPATTVSFSVNDSTIAFSQDLVYIQDIDSTHTTLISAQYPDSSAKQGSLGIRVLSDTTGRFTGGNLLATYTDGNGNLYYTNSDSTNYVQLSTYPKTYDGVVTGTFAMTVTGTAGTVHLVNGSISAIYQQ